MVEQDPFGLRRRQAAAHAEGVILQAHQGGSTDVVLLDRVDDLPQADTAYCVHGKATCVGCGAWCWLGDHSHRLTVSGAAAPLCRPCGAQVIPAGTRRAHNVGDHLRADGPH